MTNEELRAMLEELSTSELQQMARLVKAQGKPLKLTQEQVSALVDTAAKVEAVEPPKRIKKPVSDEEQQRRQEAQQAAEKLRIANRAQIGRLKGMRQHKENTPLQLAEFQFIGEQKARANSPETIKGYQRTFKKLYLFIAMMYGVKDGVAIINMEEDLPEEEMLSIGKVFPLDVLEANDLIEDFRWYIQQYDGSSEITANYYIRHLKAIIKYFAGEGVIEDRKIVLKEDMPTIKDVYTDEELRKLMRKPTNEDDYIECRNHAIIHTFMGTGCRVSTLTALRVGDIDFDNHLIIMEKQKNRKPNIIPLQQSTLEPLLKAYIYAWRSDDEGNPLNSQQLFCRYDGEEATVESIKQAISAYNKKRGVEKTSCHLFRHTFAKRWILAGKSAIELKKVLNHSSMKMVEHYSNLWATDMKDSIEEASLLSQVKKPMGKKLQKNRLQRRR